MEDRQRIENRWDYPMSAFNTIVRNSIIALVSFALLLYTALISTMRKKLITIIALVTLIFIFYTNSSLLLTKYAHLFIVDTPSKGADMIVILAGNVETRPAKAIELLRQGYAKKLYITDEKQQAPKYKNIIYKESLIIKEIMRQEKISFGVIKSTKGGATSTFDEAHDLAFFIKHNKSINHVILVTDSYHTARAQYAFRKVLRKHEISIKLEMAAAENEVFNEENWWITEDGLICYILEPIKFIVYFFRDSTVPF